MSQVLIPLSFAKNGAYLRNWIYWEALEGGDLERWVLV
jgi:hypothetical protein